jgi:hypothetical protein
MLLLLLLLTCRFSMQLSHAPRALAAFSLARHSPHEPQCRKPPALHHDDASAQLGAALAAMIGMLACEVEVSPSRTCCKSSPC